MPVPSTGLLPSPALRECATRQRARPRWLDSGRSGEPHSSPALLSPILLGLAFDGGCCRVLHCGVIFAQTATSGLVTPQMQETERSLTNVTARLRGPQ